MNFCCWGVFLGFVWDLPYLKRNCPPARESRIEKL
jgi:hypothetical protein